MKMEKREELIAEITKVYDYYNGLSAQLMKLEQDQGKEEGESKILSNYHSNVKCSLEIEKLEQENKSCQKEISFLKDLLRRCNDKLNRYIHTIDDNESLTDDFNVGNESGGGKSLAADLPRKSVYKLSALLLAYDETSVEQEAAIRRLTSSVEKLYKQMKVLADENNSFHHFFKTFSQKSTCEGDPSQTAEDIELLVEERGLMREEIEELRQRQSKREEEREERVEALKARVREEKGVSTGLEGQLEERTAEWERAREELSRAVAERRDWVSQEEHTKSIEQCAKYLKLLKGRYGTETGRLTRRAQKCVAQNAALKDDLLRTSQAARGARKEALGSRAKARRSSSQLSRNLTALRCLKSSNQSLRLKLRNLSRICSRLLEDRRQLIQDARRLKRESHSVSGGATAATSKLGKLTIKFKDERLQMGLRLSEAEGRLKEAEAAWAKAVREQARLQKMLRSKDESLSAVLSQLRFVSGRQ